MPRLLFGTTLPNHFGLLSKSDAQAYTGLSRFWELWEGTIHRLSRAIISYCILVV